MEHYILGTTLPALEIRLQAGESILADSGELSWMTDSINLKTSTQGGGGKGLFGAIKRVVGGGTLFLTEYSANGRPGAVTFATKMPGSILPINIEPGNGYMVHRHGFLAGTTGVQITAGFQKTLGAGIFGGEGFVLQKLSGQAHAWIGLSGEVVIVDLAPGETLRAHPGHVGMFQERVSFDITMMKGISNAIFGGDGLFLAALTGPGRVWLQTLPLPNLAHALVPYLPSKS
ncbi:MAG TPA: TIGR00266 family protein [Chloroflexota bacterium]|nr:TIGR00266 family protein [Chloroflexota bacterium]